MDAGFQARRESIFRFSVNHVLKTIHMICMRMRMASVRLYTYMTARRNWRALARSITQCPKYGHVHKVMHSL